MHVLSASVPAPICSTALKAGFARDINDVLAKAVSVDPDRFAGFAHLPMQSPQAAADELDRAVRSLASAAP